MEKNPPEKSVSFTGRNGFRKNDTSSPRTSTLTTVDERSDSHETKDIFGRETVDDDDDDDECFFDHDHNLDQVSEDVDRFTDSLSAVDDKSNPPEVPDAVETFSKIVESRISKYSTCEPPARFGKMTEEDSFFFEAVRRLSKLTNAFSEFPTTLSLNRTTMVLQRAMSFMEEEFRALLEDSRTSSSNSNTKVLSSKQHSFSSKVDDYDRCILPDPESTGDDDFPAYSPDVVIKMNRIASAMISAGYETECCQVYSISRRNAFNEALKKLEFEKISIDDVQRMQWESLEGQITTWIKVVKQCATVLFPGERRLCESVFSHHNSISRSLFSNLARATIIQFLNFAEAVALTKRSAEKLFKFLDMNETLRDLIPAIDESCSDDSGHELKFEISAAADRIGEAAVNIYSDLENSIKSDAGKTPVPGGAIHPLTRYVMNYLKYSCEYKDTLEQIFQQNKKIEQQRTLSITTTKSNGPEYEIENQTNNQRVENSSPFSIQLITVMDLLDANLEAKSKLYKDLSLRYIFLMNNGRYILQKIKGSTEIYQSMGDTWCRKRSTELRHYHKSYQRETWGKVLQCLRHEGLLVNGKVIKPVLKERFKNFNTLFDEIHKTQGTWVVSDEQLQSELRVSVSAVVTPAYRSFLGRFRQYLEGKQSEKYIKYQSEDIETLIEELFDGNPTSMGRRRT